MVDYTLDVWLLSDFDGNLGDTPVSGTNDNSTTGGGSTGTSTLDSGATEFTLSFEDNDASFSDGFLDTNGQQSLTVAVTIGGTVYPIGSFVELEFIVTDTGPPEVSAMVIRINGDNVAVFAPDAVAGETYDFSELEDEVAEDYDVLCFARGTRIDGKEKPCLVEDIKIGDLIKNKAGEFVTVRWVGKSQLSSTKLARFPHLRPVQISAGALGADMPNENLTVSQQHRVYINDWRAELMFGFSEFLAPAKALINDSTITLAPINDGVEYYHIMFDEHEIISANGQWTESFFPGGQALNMLEQAAKDELFEIFPELRDDDADTTYPMAAPCLKPFELKALQS